MEALAETLNSVEPGYSALPTTKTTLYELIETIGQEVQPGEDWLVEETVLHLLDTGQVRFPDNASEFKGN